MAITAAGATMEGESLWPRLAELPLVIEACEYERLHAVLAHEFERITTHVRLVGGAAAKDVATGRVGQSVEQPVDRVLGQLIYNHLVVGYRPSNLHPNGGRSAPRVR